MTSIGGEKHHDAVTTSSAPRKRSHWAWPWILLILALPGAGRSLLLATLSSSSWSGEPPSPADRAVAAAAALSGASLWLATALLTAIVFRRAVVPVLCGIAAASFAALALHWWQPRAPFNADAAGWLSAWISPTSWVIALCAVSMLALSTYRRLRTALKGQARRADR